MTNVRAFSFSMALIILVTLNAAADAPAEPDLTGNWSGCWVSETDGHRGPLRATFCKIDESHYRVQFRGRFLKVIPFRYTVTLNVVGRDGDNVLLSGTQPLGPVFGTFEYSATATDREFRATFSSKKECGRFELTRSCR